MPTRDRWRQEWYTGYGSTNGGPLWSGTHRVLWNSTQDITGLGDNLPFTSDWWKITGGYTSGKVFDLELFDFPLDGLSNPGLWDHNGNLGGLSDVDYATKLLRRTNPSRPSVNLPISVAELRDLPSIVKELGGMRLSKLAGALKGKPLKALPLVGRASLLVQFGLMPMFSDAYKLIMFHDSVNQRIRELKKLRGPRGIRRTIELDRLSDTWTGSAVLQSSNYFCYATVTKVTTQIIKGHIRYTLHDVPDILTDDYLRSKALQAISGATFDPFVAWSLIPWTWLSDWFVDIGSYLAAHRNIIPLVHSLPAIMRHTRTETTCTNLQHNAGLRIRAPYVEHKTKQRSFASSSITAHLPFITEQQASILGSLALVRSF